MKFDLPRPVAEITQLLPLLLPLALLPLLLLVLDAWDIRALAYDSLAANCGHAPMRAHPAYA